MDLSRPAGRWVPRRAAGQRHDLRGHRRHHHDALHGVDSASTTPLDDETLPKLTEFLRTFASRGGWSRPGTDRLLLVGEETIASMLGDDGADVEHDGKRRLVVTARKQGSGAELEFVSAAEGRTWKTSWRI